MAAGVLSKPHPLHWVIEDLVGHPSFIEKSMFGCRACYVHGRLQIVLAARKRDPWNGIMITPEREAHPAILAEFPALRSHPILGKWLYLSQRHEDFETLVGKLVLAIRRNDSRFGSVPPQRKRKAGTHSKRH